MAPPPVKKQKRLVVLSSDEAGEGDDKFSSTEQISDQEAASVSRSTRVQSRSLPSRRKVTGDESLGDHRLNISDRKAKLPLERSRRKPKAKSNAVAKASKAGSLYSFFNSAVQTQNASTKIDILKHDAQEREDIIQDDFPDEGRGKPLRERKVKDQTTECYDQPRQCSSGNESSVNKEQQPNASQRFGKKFRSGEFAQPDNACEKGNSRPWSERFAPQSLDELAVHKKKILDVRRWLENAFHGPGHKRVLVLKGPSGSGKTATLTALAKTMKFDIVEWRNPIGSVLSSESFLSMAAQFEDFLDRSGKFGSLNFECPEKNNDVVLGASLIRGLEERTNKVILIEEFPNTFTKTSTALHSFRSSVLRYLAASTPLTGTSFSRKHKSSEVPTPLVMIISETLLTTSTAAADSFTAHRLLGAEILNHPGIDLIEFNPIAPTFLANALNLVIQKEARQSGRRRAPGDILLKKLGEVGDVRSAIGSLEFLCVKGSDGSDWSCRVAAKAKKGAKNASALTKMEQASIEMVTQREATLGIFHAVGKVVYNKRDEIATAASQSETDGQNPYHFSHNIRPNTSQVLVERLIDETGTDTQTFVSALHENYVPSCDGHLFIDTLNGCIDALSESDLLSPVRGDRIHYGGTRRSYGGNLFQIGTDNLLQEEICFQIAVRGLLFALPYPVKRCATNGTTGSQLSNKSDAFKMFYPTSMRLWKQTEEIETLIDRWIEIGNVGASISPGLKPVAGSVETWGNKTSAFDNENPSSPTPQDDNPMAVKIRTNVARADMVLEKLPYLAKIRRDIVRNELLELDKITQFHGVEQPKDQNPDEGGDDDMLLSGTAPWATDDPVEPRDLGRQRGAEPIFGADKNQGFDLDVRTGNVMGRLVLSDDDIEDD